MYTKTTLKNNIRLITCPQKETQAITLLVLVGVGSRYETPSLWGASHYIEHLMFKGTKKRPSTLALSKELDGVGAEYNAFTSKDYTGYYIKTDAKHLELAVDFLSDILINSLFDPIEMEREKHVIVEEIKMYKENPIMYIEDLFEQTIFHGNPLGRDIAGSRESVLSLSRKAVMDYKNSYYIPNNMVITLSGKIDDTAKKLIEHCFRFKTSTQKTIASTKAGRGVSKASGVVRSRAKSFVPIKRIVQKKPRISIDRRKTEQVQLALGFYGFNYTDKRLPALYLLSTILGGNMSSRIFIQVRERAGLAYYIHSGVNVYQDTGNLYIKAGLDLNRLEKALSLILKELRKIRDNGVTHNELERAKEFLHGKMTLKFEDSFYIAEWYGKQELMKKKIETPEEKFKKFNSVRRDQVQRVAKTIINEKLLNIAIIGDVKDKTEIQQLLS